MRHFILALPLMFFAALPAAAQEEEAGDGLMQRGAQLFLEGLMKEMEPALEDLSELADELGPALRGFAEEMGPQLRDLLMQVEDWSVYEPPEMLPNGDIIIRRKPEAVPDAVEPAPEIEL